MYRSKSFDEELSRELKDRSFAQEFLLSLMEGEEGVAAEEALRVMIRSMGVKEFCDIVGAQPSNVVSFLSGARRPKPETLDAYLKPFGLRIRLTLERAS